MRLLLCLIIPDFPLRLLYFYYRWIGKNVNSTVFQVEYKKMQVEYAICFANWLFFGVWNTPYPAVILPFGAKSGLSPLKGGLTAPPAPEWRVF